MEKPTIEQVAWVFKMICDNWDGGGSFRYLIYDRMGFGLEAYTPLYLAGGMRITNVDFVEGENMQSKDEYQLWSKS